jgi:hypothetical protein
VRPYLEKNYNNSNKNNRAGGVSHEGPEFKPQYRKKKKKKI